MVQLRRFTPTGGKLNDVVSYDRTFDITPYMAAGAPGARYSLYAVVCHSGSGPHSGHYTSRVLSTDSKTWHVMDDSSVYPLNGGGSQPPLGLREAYLLMYIREKGAKLDEAIGAVPRRRRRRPPPDRLWRPQPPSARTATRNGASRRSRPRPTGRCPRRQRRRMTRLSTTTSRPSRRAMRTARTSAGRRRSSRVRFGSTRRSSPGRTRRPGATTAYRRLRSRPRPQLRLRRPPRALRPPPPRPHHPLSRRGSARDRSASAAPVRKRTAAPAARRPIRSEGVTARALAARSSTAATAGASRTRTGSRWLARAATSSRRVSSGGWAAGRRRLRGEKDLASGRAISRWSLTSYPSPFASSSL
jgi:hypothetical protein